jgi:hypothetical protein
MVANTRFVPSAGLAAIARGLSRTSGTHVCGEALKVIAAFCGLVLVALFLLATAALSTSTAFF